METNTTPLSTPPAAEEDDLQLKPEEEFLIENILPTREVHLLAGPSGSGKTTWLMGLIKAWQKGENIFGHRSFPRPFVYMVLDRSNLGTRRTFRRTGVKAKTFPLWVPSRTLQKATLLTIIERARKDHPKAKVLFIEGLASKVPGGKLIDYDVVANFLRDLGHYCEDNDVTIVGIVHASKVKGDERYENPRQRVMGSVAWAAYSETIFVVEPKNPDNPTDTTRQLFILPRNYKEQMYTLDFENGLLRPAMPKLNRSQQIMAYLATLTPNEKGLTLVTIEEIRSAMEPIPQSTLFYELDKLKKEKVLEARSPGVYLVKLQDN